MSTFYKEKFDYKNLFDLLWFCDEKWLDLSKYDNPFIQQIAMARGLIPYKDIDDCGFELKAMGILNNSDEINVFPIYFYRCPKCLAIASAKIQSSIIKKSNETNIPFL